MALEKHLCRYLRATLAAAVVLLFVLSGSRLQAQFNLGSITGTVTDPHGGSVAGVKVEVLSLTNNSARTVLTGPTGIYSAPSLAADTYQVTVEAAGFQRASARLEVAVDQTVTADFQLRLGNVSETVQVTETGAQLQVEKDTHEISHLVVSEELQELPAAGRSFISIATAGPGTGRANDVPSGPMVTFGSVANELVLAGQLVGSTSFLQDGVVNMNLLTGTANIVPPIESIQQVSVESSGMSARFSSPGLVNVISKRGTNQIHGTVYDYLGNDALDAKNFFALTTPPLRYNQFGANLGAPIIKNKLFAFFDYAGLRQSTSAVSRNRIPTNDERQGNFQADGTIYDPATFNAAAGTINPFPNNNIPVNRFSPFATQFLNFWPVTASPVVSGINYTVNLVTPVNHNSYTGRMDHNLSSRDTLSGMIQVADSPGRSTTISPAFNLIGQISGVNAYIQDIHIFSPSMINIARIGYNRSIIVIGPRIEGTQDFVQLFGLQNLTLPKDQSVPPTAAITGCCSLGYASYPMGGKQNLFQYADEVNWTKGKHQIFFGAEIDRLQFDGVWQNQDGGSYGFDGQYTSNHLTGAALKLGPGLADFMLGYPSSAGGAQGVPEGAFRSTNVAGYFQDTWKILPKLTLNLGLRYEFFQPPNDKYGQAEVFNIPANTYIPGAWAPEYHDFGPRIGFAYAISNNTVIRSGFGIHYASEPFQYLQLMLEDPPHYILQSVTLNINTPVPVENVFVAHPASSAVSPLALGLKMPTPYTEQWNFGIQRSFGSKLLATVSYVGNASHHQSERFDINQAFQDPDPSHPTPLLSRRPYPFVGDVTAQYNIGSATYNSLQSTLQYRLSHGLSFQASYSWSKALDLSDGGATTPVNSHDLAGSYGLSNFDRAQTFNISYVYELPVGSGKPFLSQMGWVSKQVLGGWNVSGITTKDTGAPFEIQAPDTSNTGTGSHIQVGNRVCNGNLPSGQRSIQQWFQTSCFVQPPPGVLGNEGRNVLWAPGFTNFDLAAFKRFPFGEKRWVQFRAEFFGAFNHPVFGIGPAPLQATQTIGSPTYGQLTTAAGARTITVSLKVAF